MGARRLVVGNWKLHKTPVESASFLRNLISGIAGEEPGCDLAVAPGFLSLRQAHGILEGSPVALAAQNCHWEDEGPFTGEVSARALRETGCRFVIVGHSERREQFGETDRHVNRKASAVLRAGMTPIVCVGEQAADRDAGRAFEVVERQLSLALANLRLEEGGTLAVAYEPIWAIGTGRNATPTQAAEIHSAIRTGLMGVFGQERAAGIKVLYGGSVSPSNAGDLMAREEIDGALVGGASLDTDSFLAICRAAGGGTTT